MSDESFPELFFAVWWLLAGWLDAAKKICARYAGRMQVGPSSSLDDEVGRAWKVQHLIMIGRCQPPSSSSSASSSLEVGARTTRSEAQSRCSIIVIYLLDGEQTSRVIAALVVVVVGKAFSAPSGWFTSVCAAVRVSSCLLC